VAYGDSVIVETEYINTEAAKIQFKYRLFRKSDGELVATATTTQVFINLEREMLLYPPVFALEWKKRMGLIKEIR
ncbi:MAG: 4-hydroxybenzoyl-CoA thioesterase, partial [Bacteroidetes bacterium CG_4_10_14_3_um_filter_42_6]